jgi:ADP-ribosylglycohydrolase
MNSRSNGSLMRCTPIAVWASGIEKENDFYKAIEADVRFTHPNKLVIDSVYLYCTAIK